MRTFAGRKSLLSHYAGLRTAFPGARLQLDHVCSQPFGPSGHHVAVRWSIAALHDGPFHGIEASGRPVYAVGVTHWRLLHGRIISEWTVFDELAMTAQVLAGGA